MARHLFAGCIAIAMLACLTIVVASQPLAAQSEDVGPRGDVQSIDSSTDGTAVGVGEDTPKHFIFRQPGPILNSTLYADGSQVQYDTVIETRLMCGSHCSVFTYDDLLAVAAAHRPHFDIQKDDPPSGEPRDGGGEPRSGLNVVFNVSNPPTGAQAAIDAVETYLESTFLDSITVTIDLSFVAMGDPNILGSTSSSRIANVQWTAARTGLINGMDVSDYIQDHLPLVATNRIPVRYNGYSSTVTNEQYVDVNRATYNATIGSAGGTAATMWINTDFNWDYTPPAITSGYYCFQSVLVHEVGHALGFVSAADSPSGGYMELMDAFRFQRTDGAGDYNPDSVAEFETTARLVDYNTPDDDHNTVLYESGGGEIEYRMSDGDYYQASHFRQGSVNGIMQPAIGSGETFYPNFYRDADIEVFDAIGWDDVGHLPDNDDCGDATAVGDGTFEGTTAFATNDGSATCGTSSSTPDVWYTFTTGSAGTLIAETCGSGFDTVLSIYTGACGSLSQVDCDDDSDTCGGGSNRSYLSIAAAADTTYYIRVSGYDGETGDYSLYIDGPVPDVTPPAPDPPTWVVDPTAISTTEVQMQGWAEDSQTPPVEYYFEGIAGGHTRGWSTDATYTDIGISPNSLVAYYLSARDSSIGQNETTSSARGAYTLIETPTQLTDGVIDDTSIEVFTASAGGGSFSNLTVGSSGLYFDVSTTGGSPVGGADANTWVQYTPHTIVATGLSPDTTYRFRVQARNQYGVVTGWYPAAGYIEFDTTGGGATCGNTFGDINGDTYVDGADIGGFVRAKLELPPAFGEDQYCAHVDGNTEQEDIDDFIVLLLN